jgi:type I restriction enzyme S subunit
VRLAAVAQIQTGIAKGSKRLVDPVELPYLRVANVQAGVLDLTEIKMIEVDRADVERYSLRTGDVLMTEGGDFDKLGRGAIWTGAIEPCLHQNHIFAVRCDRSKVLPEWLSWISSSHYGRRYFLLCSKQSTNLASINSSQLKAFPLPLPSLAQQEEMAGAVHALEAHIATLSKLIDAKRTFRWGLAGEILTGERRFAEFRDHSWDEIRLGEVLNERNETNRPDLPLLSVTNDRGVIPRDELDRRDTSNPDKAKYKRVAIGDITYNTMRMWQGVSALSSIEGIVSPAYTVAMPTDRIHGGFAKHLFKWPPVIHLFHRHSQGLVDDTLNLKFSRFAKIRLLIPRNTGEQERIASALDLCDAELKLLEVLRGQFKESKRALISGLLSGGFSARAT